MATTEKQVYSFSLPKVYIDKLLDSLDEQAPGPQAAERRSRRWPFRSLRVVIDVLDDNKQAESRFQVATRNISAHGLAFLHKQMIAPDKRLRIAVPLIDNQTIVLLARVIRCRYIKDMIHEVGVEFLSFVNTPSPEPA